MIPILAIALNPTLDVSSDCARVQPTLKIRTHGQQFFPGGGGVNVARVIAELGGEPELAYLSGGPTGVVLDELLKGLPVRLHRFPMRGAVRVSMTLFEQETGFEYRAVPEGPQVNEAEIKPVMDLLRGFKGGFVVASGSLPPGIGPDTYARMADIVQANGGRFVLDTSGDALRETLEKSAIFLLKPSIGELSALSGEKLDEASAEIFAMDLVRRGKVQFITVTMGRDGAFMASRDGILRLPPIHVRTKSAVGAGDSFVAAMVLKLAQGAQAGEAFRFALAAGAAAAMTPGTQLCLRGDVEKLFARLRA